MQMPLPGLENDAVSILVPVLLRVPRVCFRCTRMLSVRQARYMRTHDMRHARRVLIQTTHTEEVVGHFIPVGDRRHVIDEDVSAALVFAQTAAHPHQSVGAALALLLRLIIIVLFHPLLALNHARAVRDLERVVGGMGLHGIDQAYDLDGEQLGARHAEDVVGIIRLQQLLDGHGDQGLSLLGSL